MKMKRCAKKIVALLAVALMVVSMLGITAFADEPTTYTINVESSNETAGTVSGGGTIEANTDTTIIASANKGYSFVEWKEGDTSVSDQATYTVTATKDTTYTAVFQANAAKVTLNKNVDAGGTVSADKDSYVIGDTPTITATAATGYAFSGWAIGEATEPTIPGSSYTLPALTGDVTYTAYFEPQTYTITVGVSPEKSGEVKMTGDNTYGSEVTLTATAASGYKLVSWQDKDGNTLKDSKGNTITDTTYKFTVSGDAGYTAVFEKTYTLTYVVTGDSTYGTPTDSVTPTAVTGVKNTIVKLTTKPTTSWKYSKGTSTGVKGTWKFSGWYSDKAMTKSCTSYTLTDSDVTVYGKWTFTPSSSSSTTSTTSPKTGETSPILPLMCVAIAACGAAVLVSRKRIAQ